MLLPHSLAFLSTTLIVVQAVDLYQGLRDANATKFAQWIQSDADLSAIFTNASVKTIFAPSDSAFNNVNKTDFHRSLLRRQQDSRKEALQHTSDTATDYSTMGLPHGNEVPTNLRADGNRNQPVVSRPKKAPGGTKMLSMRADETTGVSLFSGLGDNVTIVKWDTLYDGGRIHTIDGIFTIPQSLTATLAAKNLTSFASGIQTTNLTDVVSNPSAAGVTVFVPSNAAYTAGISPNASSLTATLSHHIIPGFLGFLPSLNDGAVLTTQSGMTVTVYVRGDEYFINDAKIVAGDLITSNGVAHVLDKVITPAPQPFTGAAGSSLIQMPSTVVAAWSITASLLFAWLMT